MRYREKIAQEQKEWVNGYEHNLSIVLKIKRDEAKQIESEKKNQEASIKTYLWINIVFAGLSLKVIEYDPWWVLFILFYVVVSISIFALLFGLMQIKHSLYPSMSSVEYFASLPNDLWVKSQGYLSAIDSYRRVNKYNGIMLVRKARWIWQAKVVTLASFILFLGLGFSILQNKANEMASKPSNPPTKPLKVSPIIKRDSGSYPKAPPTAPKK